MAHPDDGEVVLVGYSRGSGDLLRPHLVEALPLLRRSAILLHNRLLLFVDTVAVNGLLELRFFLVVSQTHARLLQLLDVFVPLIRLLVEP